MIDIIGSVEEMMGITEKKFLIVGKETYMYPFYYIVDEWKNNNSVATFWINPHESEFSECDLNRSTFYAFQRKGIKAYTLKSALEAYDRFCGEESLYDELKTIERNYSCFKNINQQIISDQMMSVCYHTRSFNTPPTYEQQMLWIKCIYKNIEEILDDYKPDVIFDCDIAELPRTVLNEVAHKRAIPYITLNYPRYDLYKIPSYTLDIGVEGYLYKEYLDCLKDDNFDEKKYIEKYREASAIKNSSFQIPGNPTYQYKAEPFLDTVKSIYGRWIYFIKQDHSKKNRRLKKSNPAVFVNSKKYMRFWVKDRLFRRWLYKSNGFFDNPIEGEPYVYLPLHLVPESTTYSLAPFWINELMIIEAVSKALPIGWMLYVKEHQSMLGERSRGFYKRVKSLPNVRLVQFNYYEDPKPWINKAKAVVTITGTSAYEAALLGKPAFIFGDVPFAMIKGVTRVKSIEELPLLLSSVESQEKLDNIDECAAYLHAVKKVGMDIDLGFIMNAAYKNLVFGTALEDEFWQEIEKLRLFFEDAYYKAKERSELERVRL